MKTTFDKGYHLTNAPQNSCIQAFMFNKRFDLYRTLIGTVLRISFSMVLGCLSGVVVFIALFIILFLIGAYFQNS